VEAAILCREKSPHAPEVPASGAPSFLERLVAHGATRAGLNDLGCIRVSPIMQTDAFREADILHFHGLHSGFLGYLGLPALTREKPAAFTLHDSWALTGHCTTPFGCTRWMSGCGDCPFPDAYPSIRRDATHLEWMLKRAIYRHSTLHIIALNNTQLDECRKSILREKPSTLIPHGIDPDVFRPLDRTACRRALGLPMNRFILLVTAMNLLSRAKGSDLLKRALNSLPESLKKRTLLLLVGRRGEGYSGATGMDSLPLGLIVGDRLKPIAYSAADLLVSASREEAFGLAILEGMGCGLPAGVFDMPSMRELITPEVTGRLARYGDACDMGSCVASLMESGSPLRDMGEECRRSVESRFTLSSEVERHIALYSAMLGVGHADRVRLEPGSGKSRNTGL
jgi:glycosyltransferase involved in cell wall biosynthesis